MSWRMKLADWISGGELTRLDSKNSDLLMGKGYLSARVIQIGTLRAALREISHMRTPRCASIGNRMADIAEEALR